MYMYGQMYSTQVHVCLHSICIYLSHEVALEVGDAGYHSLARLTPVEVHDGQLPALAAVTWLQPRPTAAFCEE